MCKRYFDENPNTSCILYDSANCNGEERSMTLQNGDSLSNVRNITSWDVESISVRTGCQLTVDTGSWVVVLKSILHDEC